MSKSPNHWNGRKGWTPDMIVCHITEGYFDGALSWLCNPSAQVSAHYLVGSNGRKEQLVDLVDGAWCNGDLNKPTSKIVKERGTTNPNCYTYSIEHEGFSYKERYGKLTEEQYQSSLQCMKEIIEFTEKNYGIEFQIDRDHIIGHYEINSVDKINCPAPNKNDFPFDRFISDLRAWKEPEPFSIGQVVYPIQDVVLYSTAGYSGSDTAILKKDTKCFVNKYHRVNGLYVALTDELGNYFNCTWTKEFNLFTTTEPPKEIISESEEPSPNDENIDDTDENNNNDIDIPNEAENVENQEKNTSGNVLLDLIKKIVELILRLLKKA